MGQARYLREARPGIPTPTGMTVEAEVRDVREDGVAEIGAGRAAKQKC